jgi:hypothetical protein
METEKLQEEIPGATLAIDSSIADALPVIDAPEVEQPKQTPGAHMTPEKLMGLLRKMVNSEQMTKEQARQMRRQFGITQSYFTGKKVSREEKKKKKAIATASKRANRYNESSKGVSRQRGRGAD